MKLINPISAIRLNTIGDLPGTEKQAAIAAIGTNFTILRPANNATGFTGKVTGPALDSDTQEQPCAADFSKLKNPGDHPLAVPGGLSFGK